MATIYHDNDADLTLLNGRTVGIIGYGNQGRAQAQNLRDSGVAVVVGSREGQGMAQAKADGFPVHSIEDAAKAADILLLLIPDEVQPATYRAEIHRHLKPGDVLSFASGYNIHYRKIHPPEHVDVILCAPRMIGQAVRDLFTQGKGYPCLIGVDQDASGKAKAIALALAKGIGATRLGAFDSSFEEETVIDLYAEQMLWPGITQLCLLYFEKLVDAGCDPEVVATELHLSGEFVEIAKAMITSGFFEQLNLHSQTSQYGQLSRGTRMRPLEIVERANRAMHEIKSGLFAREWQAEQEAGKPRLKQLWQDALNHPLIQAETKLEPLRKAIAAMIEED